MTITDQSRFSEGFSAVIDGSIRTVSVLVDIGGEMIAVLVVAVSRLRAMLRSPSLSLPALRSAARAASSLSAAARSWVAPLDRCWLTRLLMERYLIGRRGLGSRITRDEGKRMEFKLVLDGKTGGTANKGHYE
jgi:hypothetical protein